MSADRLRLAAASMREQYLPGRGFTDDTFLAVADWLEAVAPGVLLDHDNCLPTDCGHRAALNVARAYLGDQP